MQTETLILNINMVRIWVGSFSSELRLRLNLLYYLKIYVLLTDFSSTTDNLLVASDAIAQSGNLHEQQKLLNIT